MRIWRFAFVSCVCVLLLVGSGAAFAHAPNGIDLHWDASLRVLDVNVLHPVSAINEHYVSRITVLAGKRVVAFRDYTMQTNFKSQMDVFYLKPLHNGMKVTVIAKCNKKGSKSASMILGRPRKK